MKVILKTLGEIEEEFKPKSFVFVDDRNFFEIRTDDFKWIINNSMKRNFGKEFNVEKVESCNNYTHKGEDHCYYHESWFKPEYEDFIKEEEFKI